jgi:4-hydroxybenzoyl-CoA reductase subunit beta
MLPLPVFDHHRPRTLDEAVALLAALGDKARILAGGTDLLPNMKHGLVEPEHLVSIGRIDELRGIGLAKADAHGPERLVVGADARLAELADSLLARRVAPALAEAAASVGGPHHRAMGTLGGNVCLDTRCRFVNQTHFWRKALGYCLKKDGTVCHVVAGGQNCVAAASNDTAPALVALDARIEILGASGPRVVAARDFWTADGIANTVLAPGELVVRVAVPIVAGRRSAHDKLRRRGAIDFPLLSVAASVDRDDAGALARVDVVVSALGAKPRRLRAASEVAPGSDAASVIAALSAAARRECKPLSNLDEDVEWRRDMVPVVVKRALARALATG